MISIRMPEPKLSVTDNRTTTTKREVDAVTGEVNYVNEEHVDSRVVFIPAALLPEVMSFSSYKGENLFKPDYGQISWRLMGQRRGQPYWYGGELEVKGYRLKKDGTPGQVYVERTFYNPRSNIGNPMPEDIWAIAQNYAPDTGFYPYRFPTPELEPID